MRSTYQSNARFFTNTRAITNENVNAIGLVRKFLTCFVANAGTITNINGSAASFVVVREFVACRVSDTSPFANMNVKVQIFCQSLACRVALARVWADRYS